MESLETLKDVIIADMILEVKRMTRVQLECALIGEKAEKIEALKGIEEIIHYGKSKN